MKHSCEYYMNQYLALDKGERLPCKLTTHILNCPSCRKEIKTFAHAEKIASEPIKIPAQVDVEEVRKIVAQIDPQYKANKPYVSLGSWIFFGIFLLLAIFTFNILTIKSRVLIFTFYYSAAIALVAYTLSFFACNLDFFIKRLHMKTSQ